MKKIVIIIFLLSFIASPIFSKEVSKDLIISRDRWFSKDKFNHLISSAFLYSWQHKILTNVCQIEKSKSIVISICLTECWGFMKEVSDSNKKNNHFSYKDLIFDTIGTFLGFIICQ
ncbi:MAG: hypothetical protein ISS28_08200 [Candidatus Cloacimonetes bacterium]|nr:hypothetical protein [Candidatus Cloacimonadota bacterium]MBL7087054.1 hypothetical protein [Candidatus Cloacimonadota bacterium]